jgi:hypothetical protein
MQKFAATSLLFAGLVLPVVVFWLLQSRAHFGAPIAAAISIAIGWAMSYGWATTAKESIAVAAKFGWACPAVLVFLTWLVMRWVE